MFAMPFMLLHIVLHARLMIFLSKVYIVNLLVREILHGYSACTRVLSSYSGLISVTAAYRYAG